MEEIIPKLGKYRHFKGNEYEVIGVGRHTETMARHVIYKGDSGPIWIRPLEMFMGVTEDGIKRFEYLGD